jgi:hypothetical protein
MDRVSKLKLVQNLNLINHFLPPDAVTGRPLLKPSLTSQQPVNRSEAATAKQALIQPSGFHLPFS